MNEWYLKPYQQILSSLTEDEDRSSPVGKEQTCDVLPLHHSKTRQGKATSKPPSSSSVTLKSLTSSLSTPRQATSSSGGLRLNKFVRRLHDMLVEEQHRGVVEWRKGLLVLHSTDEFAKKILPKYFNTRNFKTFRRQLNYYGFVHVRSFSTTGQATTALWVNQDLAKRKGCENISSVLLLKRVDPCPESKTAEGRRVRKEEAAHTVECDIGINTRSIQIDQLKFMAKANFTETNFDPDFWSIQDVTSSQTENNSVGSTGSSSAPIIDGEENFHISQKCSRENTFLENEAATCAQKMSRSKSLLQLYKSGPDDVAKLLLKLSNPKSLSHVVQ